jgi:uncharacterized protein
MRHSELRAWTDAAIAIFSTTISGLAFETLPFLLMGTLLAALIRAFVPDRVLGKLFPKNRYGSIAAALFIGVFVPICECGTVPLARRLRQKGLPLSTTTAFLLAAPLVNPMTVVSTVVAFRGTGYRMFVYRLAVGLAAALAVSLLVELASRRDAAIDLKRAEMAFARPRSTALPRPPRLPSPDIGRGRPASRLAEALEHAVYDFLDSARFLVLGISVAAAARAVLPLGIMALGLGGRLSSAVTGTLAAYVLSLCSSADAFVARSLFAPASYTAALSFLVAGPMIDLKNTILLARFVRLGHAVALAIAVFAVVIVLTIIASPLLEALR